MTDLRDTITFGTIEVSVQASSFHYCTPRMDGLPIEAYDAVEIGLRGPHGHLTHPSRVGVGGYDQFFEDGDCPVAGYFPTDLLPAFLDQLKAAGGA